MRILKALYYDFWMASTLSSTGEYRVVQINDDFFPQRRRFLDDKWVNFETDTLDARYKTEKEAYDFIRRVCVANHPQVIEHPVIQS